MVADGDGVLLVTNRRRTQDSVLADDRAVTDLDPRALRVEYRT